MARFGPAVGDLVAFAAANNLRVYFLTLSTAVRPYSAGMVAETDEQVLADAKAAWHEFQQKGVWRRVPSALWVFGTHSRPHLHVLAVLPENVSVRALVSQWKAGHTHKIKLRPNHERLIAYFAAQGSSSLSQNTARQRSWGYRPPPETVLVYRATPDPTPKVTPNPSPPTFASEASPSSSAHRLCADGVAPALPRERDAGAHRDALTTAGGGRDATASWRDSACERPQAVLSVAGPTTDAGDAASVRGPCERAISAAHLPSASSPAPAPIGPTLPPAPSRAANVLAALTSTPSLPYYGFEPGDVTIGEAALLPVVPRDRDAAVDRWALKFSVDLNSALVDLALNSLVARGVVHRGGLGTKSRPHRFYLAHEPLAPPHTDVPRRLRRDVFFAPPVELWNGSAKAITTFQHTAGGTDE